MDVPTFFSIRDTHTDRQTDRHTLSFIYIDKLKVKTHTMNTLGNSFNYKVVKIWNSLPSDVIASKTVCTFKNRLDSV